MGEKDKKEYPILKRFGHFGLILAIMALIYFLLAPIKNDPIPVVDVSELIGIWKTDSPKYEDRFFRIEKDTVTFGQGRGNFTTYVIEKIEIEPKKNGQSFVRVRYSHLDGVDLNLDFEYSNKDSGTILLKSQPDMAWVRASHAGENEID